jgi:hypothetical protein
VVVFNILRILFIFSLFSGSRLVCLLIAGLIFLVFLGGLWAILHYFLGDDADPVDRDGQAMAGGIVGP